MKQGLQELNGKELTIALEQALLPRLIDCLNNRRAGHCMRVSNLSTGLMVRLCSLLKSEVPEAEIAILWDTQPEPLPDNMGISATKLVELRNPLPNGDLRPPLLVFIPDDLRTSAEDSFGVATFEDIQIGNIYENVATAILERLPKSLSKLLHEILRRIQKENWIYAGSDAIARFLLTIEANDAEESIVGAALFELGLVPDFDLLKDPSRILKKIERNIESVRKLTWSTQSERQRLLELGLEDRTFRNQLSDFLIEIGLEDPKRWTRRIVLDRSLWNFAFNRWKFEDDGEDTDSICITLTDLGIPTITEEESKNNPRLASLIDQKVLATGKRGTSSFSITFSTKPYPSKINGLAKFVAQVISEDTGAPVGLVRNKTAWNTKKAAAKIPFNKYQKFAWEEGWHYIRILPLTDAGDVLPLVDAEGHPLDDKAEDSTNTYPHESDLFYVLPDDNVDIAPPPRAVQRENSLVHALMKLQFSAVQAGRPPSSVEVSATSWDVKSPNFIKTKFGREGSINIPVPESLRTIEQTILSEPEGGISWHVSINSGIVGKLTNRLSQWPSDDATEAFLGVRSQYFEAVRQDRQDDQQLVTQAANFYQLQDLVLQYASTYQGAINYQLEQIRTSEGDLQQKSLSALRTLLAVDTVALTLVDYRGQTREAALISPTHPLKALWLATWAQVGQSWIQQVSSGIEESLVVARDTLLRKMAPISFPPVLTLGDSHILTTVDNIHFLWTLYASTQEVNPRGLIGEVCAAFKLEETGIDGASINGTYLASRLRRYLLQHPYIRTLTLNVFNPGRGAVLTETLLELQKCNEFADLNYDVRLFVPDPDAIGVGGDLFNLLLPTSTVSVKEADAFSTPSNHHLYPKLSLAVRSNQEFQNAPSEHLAHLSILFDVFPVEQIAAAPATVTEASAPVHGLYQTFESDYLEDDAIVRWQRKPKHGKALPIQNNAALTELMGELPETISAATVAIATGKVNQNLRPVLTLSLSTDDRALIFRVHEVSDWVITIDRNMGIEFFDHGGLSNRPDYLIDHSPEQTSNLGHRLVITSRSTAELEAMVRPVLESYQLPSSEPYARAVLDQVRSLSGQLALKLISAPTQRAEVLGLSLAHMYLDYQGVFANQIVIPLDAHIELYRSLQKQADELGDEVSFKRTDLALFDLNAAARTITCRLVEVKCYNQGEDFTRLKQLKESIAEQIKQSETVLSYHFNSQRLANDRPDRLVKTRELALLLETYLDRGVRYKLIEPEVNQEARHLLDTLEMGYQLTFTYSGLIFDLAKSGTEASEKESGIEFHRIGSDLIKEMLEALAETTKVVTDISENEVQPLTTLTAAATTTERLRRKVVSVPKLSDAAFLGEMRDRTISLSSDMPSLLSKTTENSTLNGEEIIAEDNTDQSEESVTTHNSDASDEDRKETNTKEQYSEKQVIEEKKLTPSSASVTNLYQSSQTTIYQDESLDTESFNDVDSFDVSAPKYDVLLGSNAKSPQFGILGEISGRKIAVDLNQTHTISLFGVQGGGKSYTLGTIAEMASLPIPNINCLPQPLTTIIFHYSPTQDYSPEFTSMVNPNSEQKQIAALKDRYGAEPKALTDVILLTPGDKLADRQRDYPDVEVYPLKFSASELQVNHWRFLMGATGNQSTYMRQLNRIMKANRNNLTTQVIREGIDGSTLSEAIKGLAHQRLDLASEYISDQANLTNLIQPGRLIIVDLRDEFIEKDEALGLFLVLLQLFSDAEFENNQSNKLVVFDEAHKYIESPELLSGLIEVVREMRHKGTSIMIASQDPSSVPTSLIELSSQIILHKFNSPAWLKHIQKANAALHSLTSSKMSQLSPGEAYIWSNKATDDAFIKDAIKIQCRPRVTQHGGATKTALST